VTPHPIFTLLICDEVDIKEIEGGRSEITASYFGPATGLTMGGPPTKPYYELSGEASEQPIETYKDFSSTIGTAGNGAKFDEHGLFIGFAPDSEFAGQSAWLVPGQIFRKRDILLSPPSASALALVGKIDSPDGWIGTPTGRNWLLRSFDVTQRGNIYPYTKTWELSGPNGWNATIYSPA